MPGRIPPEDEVLGYLDSCSNWGRWGADDQLGTLNHLTPEHRRAAAALVRDGVSVTCAREIPTHASEPDFPSPPLHFMLQSGEAYAGRATAPDTLQSASDFVGLAFHGLAVTHLDALCHVFRDGRMYNGHPADRVTTSQGAAIQSVELVRDGVVGRGVLLDVARLRGKPWLEPGEPVFPEDLEEAERAQGVCTGPGDILLCRFGTVAMRNAQGPSVGVFQARPGLHAACVPWVHARAVAVLGSDTAQDVFPAGYASMRSPFHQIGIAKMGLWLIDNCDLEPLAAACARANRWEFLFTMGPLRIRNGTGSPVNPIAVL